MALDRDIRRALGHVRPYAWRLVPVVALSLASTALSLATPFLTKVLVDRALIGRDPRALVATTAGFLALTVVGFAINMFVGLRYTRVSADILFDMRLAVFERLQRLSPRWFTRTPIGQIASRINSDIGEIQRVAAEVALAWIGHVAFLVGSVVMLVILDVRLFLAAVAVLPAAIWALVAYRRRLESAVTATRDRSASVGSFLIEALQGMTLVVSFNAQARSVDEFRTRNASFVEALMAMRRLTYLSGGLPGLLLAIGGSAVFLYGGWRVIDGAISMGTLVAFAAYQVRLMGPIQGLMGIYTSIASARVSLRRVSEILDTPIDIEERAGAIAIPSARGELSLSHVSFTYERGAPVLDDVSFTIAASTRVALVGASGVGKSTIADLLVRHIDPQSGTIALDGTSLADARLADVRRHVVVVDAEPFVFHASVAENLRLARPDASEAAMRDALGAAGLLGWLDGLPDGAATVVGERGRAMSTGERQRLALARAILSDPAVLVLDEALGGLDPDTEGRIGGAVEEWMRRRTTIWITHRLDVARRAERVIVLQQGRVVEDGATDALIARGGAFARIFGSLEPVG